MKITAGTPWAPYLLVFVFALLAGHGTLIGQDEPDTLRLATAVTIAREINPTLRASILSAGIQGGCPARSDGHAGLDELVDQRLQPQRTDVDERNPAVSEIPLAGQARLQ